MFVDASAIVALITNEPDAELLESKLGMASQIITSPMAVYEAVLGIARKRTGDLEIARESVEALLREVEIKTVPIDEIIGNEAIDAFQKFGRGNHKAALNMGDCFSYACAKVHRVPLLFKGNDFVHTDVRIA
jgi:ribonuclease VapC